MMPGMPPGMMPPGMPPFMPPGMVPGMGTSPWQEFTSPDGRTYYHNPATGVGTLPSLSLPSYFFKMEIEVR